MFLSRGDRDIRVAFQSHPVGHASSRVEAKAQKGLKVGLMTSDYFTAVILLIIVSSIVTPITLKLCFNKWKDTDCESGASENEAAPAEDAPAAPAEAPADNAAKA